MIHLVYFREDDGSSPFVDWFRALPVKAQDRCRARLHLLTNQGHLFRRPAVDYLRDGIYELRVKAEGINYRILYFFRGQEAVVISHGIVKQQAAVPGIEIARARDRKRVFTADPSWHTAKLKEPL